MRKKSDEITKQFENELVLHQNVVRVKGILTLNQGRGMRALLKYANELVYDKNDIERFSIPVKKFIELTFVDRKTKKGRKAIFEEVYKDMENLIDIKLVWGTETEREQATFLQYFKINEKTITFEFSNYVRKYIAPAHKALIIENFEMIQSFRSKYAAELYKHIKCWAKAFDRKAFRIEELREFLGVPNTKTYKSATELRTRILDRAVAEISKKSDLLLSYNTNKIDGVKEIEGFTFIWQIKPEYIKKKKGK